MGIGWPLARSMAVLIGLIIACVSPTAVQAHGGHAHRGHAQVAAARLASVAVALRATPAAAKGASAVLPTVIPESRANSFVAGTTRADEQGGACGSGPCRGDGCGTTCCCSPGILASSVVLPTPASGDVVLVSREVDGRLGTDPQALPEPPRPFT